MSQQLDEKLKSLKIPVIPADLIESGGFSISEITYYFHKIKYPQPLYFSFEFDKENLFFRCKTDLFGPNGLVLESRSFSGLWAEISRVLTDIIVFNASFFYKHDDDAREILLMKPNYRFSSGCIFEKIGTARCSLDLWIWSSGDATTGLPCHTQ